MNYLKTVQGHKIFGYLRLGGADTHDNVQNKLNY